ncbi:MAG: DUF4926 domain-containing protein, partial [Bacteroidetes bacterium QS_8_68_15]
MAASFELLDVVALTESRPDHLLYVGQVGTVVEELAPDVYEVEFSDDDGRPYAMLPVEAGKLMK